MAFRRSPVRSRSGPPTFAHDCRRRLPTIAPKARRRACPCREPSYGWQAQPSRLPRSKNRRPTPQLPAKLTARLRAEAPQARTRPRMVRTGLGRPDSRAEIAETAILFTGAACKLCNPLVCSASCLAVIIRRMPLGCPLASPRECQPSTSSTFSEVCRSLSDLYIPASRTTWKLASPRTTPAGAPTRLDTGRGRFWLRSS